MKVIQLIDSLEAGGAERIAVSLANELSAKGIDSYLCASRAEGDLKSELRDTVTYFYLNKKSRFDSSSFRKLRKWVKSEEIEVVHAHSSSYFFGYLLKLFLPKITLIWHDHYGKSEALDQRKYGVLRHCSRKFDAIISVNDALRSWALIKLRCPNVYFLNNFVSEEAVMQSEITLKGGNEPKIICLANLRPQKDHENLLNAFEIVQKTHSCSLHLLGKSFDDDYFRSIKKQIEENKDGEIYYYGSQKGIIDILKQAHIGVLASNSEGLPVALLEYGLAGLAVVATRVGQTEEVIAEYGIIVPPNDPEALAKAIIEYLAKEDYRKQDAKLFNEHIKRNYTFGAISAELLDIYENPKRN